MIDNFTDCREVRESLLVKDMLDTLIAEVAKSLNTKTEK